MTNVKLVEVSLKDDNVYFRFVKTTGSMQTIYEGLVSAEHIWKQFGHNVKQTAIKSATLPAKPAKSK